MGLQGTFSLYKPSRLGNSIVLWQFVLKNTNLLMSETFDLMVCDCYKQRPAYFRNIKLKAGQSIAVNLDTEDWTWCQDDFAAIIDAGNNIKKKWLFHIKEYGPGECPGCHGTHKCRYCHGEGFIYPRNKIWEARSCEHCGGTGTCMRCDIPRRKPLPGMGPTGLHPF